MINILVSYAYIKKSPMMLDAIRDAQGHARVMLDSGAFTAHGQGETITLDEYCGFVADTRDLWWGYVSLDKVGDSETTERNLAAMRERGLDPMPVLTVDAHVDKAPTLIGKSASLCVAGGVTEPLTSYGPRLEEIRRRVGADVWLHGLGFTRGLRTGRTAVNSVDSSSWLSGRRFGAFQWYEPMKGVRHLGWSDMRARPWASLPARAKQALVGLNLSREDLTSRDMSRGGKSALAMQSTRAFFEYASVLEARGVRYFFAVTYPDFMQLFIAARNATRDGISWPDCQRDVKASKDGTLPRTQLFREASEQVKAQWHIQ